MAANGKHWVMLVAGSMTWTNYRHQAGVCHAYQIVHQNGIPDDQIVVMMYDDIAKNKHGGNDTIFVYLADHGGSGIFCFPNSDAVLIERRCPAAVTVSKEQISEFTRRVLNLEARIGLLEACFSEKTHPPTADQSTATDNFASVPSASAE